MKRTVTFVASLVVFTLSQLWSPVRFLLTGRRRGTCVVLYYHAVKAEHRELFARQMDMLLRYAEPACADRSEPLAPGRRYVALTFDDAYENVFQNALPELERRQIPCTVFVVTEALGKFALWYTDPSHPLRGERIMSLDQLRSLPGSLVAVGSHTLHHPKLTELDEDRARRELSDSRTWLQKVLNKDVRLFSFPHGLHNSRLVEWSRDAGYERVFTIDPTLAFSDPHEFVTGRVLASPTDWAWEFRLKLLGAYSWLPLAFFVKRKVLSLSGRFVARVGNSNSSSANPKDIGTRPLARSVKPAVDKTD